MHTRLLTLQRNYALLQGVRRYAAKQQPCEAHMNELPIPCGPWGPWYEGKQSFYTKWLVVGVIWFGITMGALYNSGCVNLFFGPPRKPGPPSKMEEECEDV